VQSYFPENGFGYPYPAYDIYNSAYQYDGYAIPTARDLERPDPFQYIDTSQAQKAARPDRPRQRRSTGREQYYNAAMVKVRGEETESDLYSDAGSTGGWTTRSVSRDRSPEGAIVEDIDDRNVEEEHRERVMKEMMLQERQLMEKQLHEKQLHQKFRQEKQMQEEQKRLQEEKEAREQPQRQHLEGQVMRKQGEEHEKLSQQDADKTKQEEEQQMPIPKLQDAPSPFREGKALPSKAAASTSEDESESTDDEGEQEDEKELSSMPGQLAPETPETKLPEQKRPEPQPKTEPLPEVAPKTSAPSLRGPSLFSTTMASLPKRQVYRRFSALNHRVLLHMQDEISELSSLLDKMDSQFPSQAGIHDASRMLYPSFEERRQQLLNNIAWKLSNYSG
jgi:hypothetical protein